MVLRELNRIEWYSDQTWSDNVVQAWTMEVVTAHWFVRVVDHLLTNPEHGGEKDPVLKHPIQVSLSRNRRSTERPAKSEVTLSIFITFKRNKSIEFITCIPNNFLPDTSLTTT